VSCNCCCGFPHYPINPLTSKPFCFQKEPTFQCPMVKFN
jgi:hypothetical protein